MKRNRIPDFIAMRILLWVLQPAAAAVIKKAGFEQKFIVV